MASNPNAIGNSQLFLIKDVAVIPMTDRALLPDHEILVDSGRVADIQPGGTIDAPTAQIIDGNSGYVMPGLIDAHAHFVPGDAEANAALLDLYLVSGNTSLLCLHGCDEVRRMRGEIESGLLEGPSIYSTGPIQNDPELDYESAVAEALAEAEAGYEFVKVYNDLSIAGYQGLIDGAAEAGIRVIGHVPRAPGLAGVLRSGQICIVHAEEFLYTHFGYTVRGRVDWRSGGTTDVGQLRDLCAQVAAAGVTVGPTLHCFFAIWQQSQDIASWARTEQLGYLPRRLTDRWLSPRNAYLEDFKEEHCRRNLLEGYWFQMRLVEELHAAGVPLTAGTDTLVPNVVPGFLHAEIAELALAGLDSYEALRTATVNVGELIDATSTLGTLVPGGRADLLLLAENPLEDPRRTTTIQGVMCRGRWYAREALDAKLAALRSTREHETWASPVNVA